MPELEPGVGASWGDIPPRPAPSGCLAFAVQVVESPSLEMFKTRLDKVLCSLL